MWLLARIIGSNNSGNDAAALVHDSNIAYDPNALYRVKARIRRTAGSGRPCKASTQV